MYQINQSARVFQDDINPVLPEASIEMPWFVLHQWLIVDLTFSTQCVRTKSNHFIRYTCPITCCMCVKRPRISPSIIVWFITAFIQPGVMASQITCNFTLRSTAFHFINKQPIYFCLNIHLMGKFTAMASKKKIPSKSVRNARHPVVSYVSDNTLISFSGMLMNWQMDAPSYQNLYNSLKDRYTTDTYRHSEELQQYQCCWCIGCNGLIYWVYPKCLSKSRVPFAF